MTRNVGILDDLLNSGPGLGALAQLQVAPKSGSPEWKQQHDDRRLQTGDFNSLDQQIKSQYTGNIDLNNRPIYPWGNGDYSSLESIGINVDGREVLIPKVVNGQLLNAGDAINHFNKTGEHLGKFMTPDEASKFAIQLERRQQSYYERGPGRAIFDEAFRRLK